MTMKQALIKAIIEYDGESEIRKVIPLEAGGNGVEYTEVLVGIYDELNNEHDILITPVTDKD